MKTKGGTTVVNSRRVKSAKTDPLEEVDSSPLQTMALRNAKQSRNDSAELTQTLPDSVSSAGSNHKLPNRKNNSGRVAHRAVTRGPVGKNSPTEASDAKQAINDLKIKRTGNVPTKVQPRRRSLQSSDSSSESQRQNIFLTINDDLSKSEIFKERGNQECFKTPGRTRTRRSGVLSGSDSDYTPRTKKSGKARKSARNLDSDNQKSESDTKSDTKNSKTESRQTSGGELSDNIEDDSDFMKNLQTKLSLGPENRKKRWEEKEKARKEAETKLSAGGRKDDNHISRPDSIVTKINNKPKRQPPSVQRKRKKKLPMRVDDSRGETSSDDDIRSIQSDFDHQPKLAIVPPRRPSTDSSSDEARPMLVGAAKKTYTIEWSPGQRRKCLSPRSLAVIDRPDVPFSAALEDLKRMKRTPPYGSPARSPRPGSSFSSQGSYRGISFQDSSESDLSDVELIVETEKTVEKQKKSINEPVELPMPVIHKEKITTPTFFKSRAKPTVANVPQKTTNVNPQKTTNVKPVSTRPKLPEMTIPVPTSQLQFVDTLCSSESDLEEEVIVSPVPLPIHPVKTGDRPISPAQAKPKPKPANIKKPFDPQKVVISVVGTCDNVTKPSIQEKPRIPVPRLSNIGRKPESVKPGSLHPHQARAGEKEPRKVFLSERTEELVRKPSRSGIASVACRDKQEITPTGLDVQQTVTLKKQNEEVRMAPTAARTHENRTTSHIQEPKVVTRNSRVKEIAQAPHQEKRALDPPKSSLSERETISTTESLREGFGKPKCGSVSTKQLETEKALDKDPLPESKSTSRSRTVVPKYSKTTPMARKETIAGRESRSPPRKATSLVLESDHRKSETTDRRSVDADSSSNVRVATSPGESNETGAQKEPSESKVSRSDLCKKNQISKQKEENSLPVFTISENVKLNRPRMKQTARKSVSPAPKIIYKEVKAPKEGTLQQTMTKEQTGTKSLQTKSKADGITTATIKMKEVLKNTLSTYKEQLGMTGNTPKQASTTNRAESSVIAGQGKAASGKKHKEDISKSSKCSQKLTVGQEDLLSDGESQIMDHTGCDDLPLDLSSIQSFDTGKSQNKKKAAKEPEEPPVITIYVPLKQAAATVKQGVLKNSKFWPGSSRRMVKENLEMSESSGSSGSDADYPAPPPKPQKVAKGLKSAAKSRPSKQPKATKTRAKTVDPKKNVDVGAKSQLLDKQQEGSKEVADKNKGAEIPTRRSGRKTRAKNEKPKVGHNIYDNEVVGPVRTLRREIHTPERYKESGMPNLGYIRISSPEGRRSDTSMSPPRKVSPVRGKTQTQKRSSVYISHNESTRPTQSNVDSHSDRESQDGCGKEPFATDTGKQELSTFQKGEYKISRNLRLQPFKKRLVLPSPPVSTESPLDREDPVDNDTIDSNFDVTDNIDDNFKVAAVFDEAGSRETNVIEIHTESPKGSRESKLPYDRQLRVDSLPSVNNDNQEVSLHGSVQSEDTVSSAQNAQDQPDSQLTSKEAKNMPQNIRPASHQGLKRTRNKSGLQRDKEVEGMTPVIDTLPSSSTSSVTAQSPSFSAVVDGDDAIWVQTNAPVRYFQGTSAEKLQGTQEEAEKVWRMESKVRMFKKDYQILDLNKIGKERLNLKFFTEFDIEQYRQHIKKKPFQLPCSEAPEKFTDEATSSDEHNEDGDVDDDDDDGESGSEEEVVLHEIEIAKNSAGISRILKIKERKPKRRWRKSKLDESNEDSLLGRSDSVDTASSVKSYPSRDPDAIVAVPGSDEDSPKGDEETAEIVDEEPGTKDETAARRGSNSERTVEAEVHVPEYEQVFSQWRKEPQDSDDNRELQDSDGDQELLLDNETNRETQDSEDNRKTEDSDENQELLPDDESNRESQDSEDNQELLSNDDRKQESQDGEDHQELLSDDDRKRESQDSEDNQELLPDADSNRESQDSEDNQELLPDDDMKRESQDSEDNQELLPDADSNQESQDSEDNQELLPDAESNQESQDSEDNQDLPEDEINRKTQDSEDNEEVQDNENDKKTQNSKNSSELQESEDNNEILYSKEKQECLNISNKEEVSNTGQINQENDEEIDAAEEATKTLAEEVCKTTLEIKAQTEAAEKVRENRQSTPEIETQDKNVEHTGIGEQRNSHNFQQSEKDMKSSSHDDTRDSEDTEGDTVGKTMVGVQKAASKHSSSLSSSQQGSRVPSRRSSFEGREDKAGDMSEVDFSMLDNPLDTDTEPGLQVNIP